MRKRALGTKAGSTGMNVEVTVAMGKLALAITAGFFITPPARSCCRPVALHVHRRRSPPLTSPAVGSPRPHLKIQNLGPHALPP
uniref:Uncharacterized protein n=1 Tax=Arundo donax TaxID=35708 RepID=A0A0A8YDJ0_ARUDO